MAPKASRASAKAVRERMQSRGLEESDSWGDWRAGDRVGIVGEAGEFFIRGFRDGNVTVVGGPWWGQSQTKEWRTFRTDRLTKKIVRRARKIIKEDDDAAEQQQELWDS